MTLGVEVSGAILVRTQSKNHTFYNTPWIASSTNGFPIFFCNKIRTSNNSEWYKCIQCRIFLSHRFIVGWKLVDFNVVRF
jgi:hypothetical protein